MKISQIMTKKVITAHPEMKVEEAADLLMENRIHGLPVVNEKNEVLGIVTESDFFSNEGNVYLPYYISLLKKINPSQIDTKNQKINLEKISEAKVEDIMTKDCFCLNQNSSINELLKLFNKKKFNMAPIVDDGNVLVGVISLMDLIKLIKK